MKSNLHKDDANEVVVEQQAELNRVKGELKAAEDAAIDLAERLDETEKARAELIEATKDCNRIRASRDEATAELARVRAALNKVADRWDFIAVGGQIREALR